MLDDRIISSRQSICRSAAGLASPAAAPQLTESSTQDEATDLAMLIEGGALTILVEIIEQRTVGATLGAEVIDVSAITALISLQFAPSSATRWTTQR